jgi:hypothetical protein
MKHVTLGIIVALDICAQSDGGDRPAIDLYSLGTIAYGLAVNGKADAIHGRCPSFVRQAFQAGLEDRA